MGNSRVNGLSNCCASACFKNTFSASCACPLLYYLYSLVVFLKLKESERTMDTLNTKRETQIVKPSVVDIPRANSFNKL